MNFKMVRFTWHSKYDSSYEIKFHILLLANQFLSFWNTKEHNRINHVAKTNANSKVIFL